MELVRAKGGKITREPMLVKGGNSVNAFIEDPDGYQFELLERAPSPEPLCKVMLRVCDLDRSIKFYEKVKVNVILRWFAVFLFSIQNIYSFVITCCLGFWYGATSNTGLSRIQGALDTHSVTDIWN